VEQAMGGATALQALGGNTVLSQVQVEQLNSLRNRLTYARVISYTFAPLVGISSISDVNSRTIYYEYDEMGRLHLLRDDERNVTKAFEYHYKYKPISEN
jgi:hypothetical protein